MPVARAFRVNPCAFRETPTSDGRITDLYVRFFDHRWRSVATTAWAAALLLSSTPHGFRPRNAQRLRPLRVRLADNAPSQARRSGARDRLRRWEGGPALPGSRAGGAYG